MDAPIRGVDPTIAAQINQDLNALETALNSMNPKDYEKGNLPSWSDGVMRPRFTFWFDSGASYTKQMEGLNLLVEKTDKILQNLQETGLNEQARQPLLQKFSRLVELIDLRAKPFFEQIIKNYQGREGEKDPQKIRDMARTASSLFARIHNVNNFLNDRHFEVDPMHRSLSESDLHRIEVPLSPMQQSLYQVHAELDTKLNRLIGFYEYNKTLLNNVVYSASDAVKIPAALIPLYHEEKEIFKSIKESAEKLAKLTKQREFDVKPLIAAANNAQANFTRVGVITTPTGDNQWISLMIVGNEVKEGSATPTSFAQKNQKLGHPTTTDLINIKVQVDPQNSHITITCGVIDTQQKADEFIKALEYAWSKRTTDAPVRVVMHQVNSWMSDPTGTIQNQHIASRYIEETIQNKMKDKVYREMHHLLPSEGPIIVHMNAPLNKASAVPVEEAYSKTINLEGLAGRLIWLADDLNKWGISNDAFKKKREQLIQLRNNVSRLKPTFENPNPSKELAKAEADLRNAIEDFGKALNAYSKRQQGLLKSFQESQQSFSIADRIKFMTATTVAETVARIVGAQLGTESIGRTTEMELHLLFDMLQSADAEINCKSGLDRTGYMRAIWDSMNHLHKRFTTEHMQKLGNLELAKAQAFADLLFTIVNQNRLTNELDEIQEELVNEQQLHFVDKLDGFDNAVRQDNFREILLKKIIAKTSNDPVKTQQLLKAWDYQNLVFSHLLANAQVITMESTGVPGLKYGHEVVGFKKMAANPHPLVRLPMFVLTDEGHLLRLYQKPSALDLLAPFLEMYHEMTGMGAVILCRLSSLRGD